MDERPEREQRGIQSVEVGGQLLKALAHHGRPMALKDLARDAAMSAAKAHPYLVSFGKIGLVEQDRLSGRYGLGPLALQLGLISLQQADPVRLATPVIHDLAQQTGHTVAVALWGNRGPTIVQLAESPLAVHVNMRPGTVFSIADTASGRLFAAYLPAAQVRPLLGGGSAETTEAAWQALSAELAAVRAEGLSRSEGAVLAGVNAMAVPVFDHTGALVLALTAIGPAAAFDTRSGGALAVAMAQAAAGLSVRLGYRGA
jgi:DNA-binding IclR family transcriptional regulator